MCDLAFHPLNSTGYQVYATWFPDPELALRLETPTQQWLQYVTTTPGTFAWLVYDATMPVALVQLDTTAERIGSIAFAVNPSLRRQGYGTAVLRALLTRPETARLQQIDAMVELDNAASRRCLSAAGFVLLSEQPDEDGFLQYTRRSGCV